MAERARQLPRGMQPYRSEMTAQGLTVMRNRLVVPRSQLDIHDTTGRDGMQKPAVNTTAVLKEQMLRRIDDLTQPDVIEAGWPGANPTDTEVFNIFKDKPLIHARLSSFGMTVAPYKHPEDDQQIQQQIDARAAIKTVVGKADIFQVERGLRKPREENLRMIEDTMAYYKADPDTEDVRFDAEHFFSGFRTDPEYALECLRAAAKGGADMVVLCDTMGDAMPEDVELAMSVVNSDQTLHEEYAKHHGEGERMPIGMHAHNDNGLAIAHSLAAIRLGARSVQGTVTGIGERLGNADLLTLMLQRTTKYGTEDIPEENLPQMRGLAELVAANSGIELNADLPYVGDNAANHKGGLHTASVLIDPELYEHIDPVKVGNRRRIAVSVQNGRAGTQYNLEQLDLPFDVTKEFAGIVIESLKEKAALGYDFERARGSFEIMARRLRPDYTPPFTITTSGDNTNSALLTVGNQSSNVSGEVKTVELTSNTQQQFETLRDQLASYFPHLSQLQLLTTRFRPQNGDIAEFISVTDGERIWTTTGVAEKSQRGLATLEAVKDAIELSIYHPPTQLGI